jgi:ATP-binding cassette subfamily B (MDR/TAP) protein 6
MIVTVAIALYIFATVVITEWRTKFRRSMVDLDNASTARAVDSLLNFEMVKLFGAEEWEVKQYDTAIAAYQHADWKSQVKKAG